MALIVVMTSSACARPLPAPQLAPPIVEEEAEEVLFEVVDETHQPKAPMVRGLWLTEENARKESARRKKRALDCKIAINEVQHETATCEQRAEQLSRELDRADAVGRRAEWVLPLTALGGIILGALLTGLVVSQVK